MIRITQIKLQIPHAEDALERKVCRLLRIQPQELLSLRILRRSVDARSKPVLFYSYTAEVRTTCDAAVLKKNKHKNVTETKMPVYRFPEPGDRTLKHPPVIIGSGPAGLFCAWMLAKHGYRPLVLERGEEASMRSRTVHTFWETGVLDPESNVQFGEGGAGTFSDGKLNTGVRDVSGRNRLVLSILYDAGAPEQILYDAKPHLGTDLLVPIVETLRRQIIDMGGTVRFRSRVDDLIIRDGAVCGVILSDGEEIPAEVVIPAIGHSARDTFEMLYRNRLSMRMKPIAVGVRAEHPQALINLQQYGTEHPSGVGAADYRLTAQLPSGRGVYTFCMCPGGYVVNASSEPGLLAVNGMSCHARDGRNANSAVVVTVTPEDYLAMRNADRTAGRDLLPEALSGIAFVRHLERAAHRTGGGAVPVQRFADFREGVPGSAGTWRPDIKGRSRYADVRAIFPETLAEDIERGILLFDRKLRGFADPETLLSGVESRTSSPVRIDRNEVYESNIHGIYPCGEGAGYAGGITSAAIDGVKIAEAVARLHKKFG